MLQVYELLTSQPHVIGTHLLRSPCPLLTPLNHDHHYGGLVKMARTPVVGNIVTHHAPLSKSSVAAINFNSLWPAVQVDQFLMIITVPEMLTTSGERIKRSKEISQRTVEFLLHLKRKHSRDGGILLICSHIIGWCCLSHGWEQVQYTGWLHLCQ